jgi:nitroreductase
MRRSGGRWPISRKAWEVYVTLPLAAGNLQLGDPVRDATQQRVMNSAGYLATHLHEVPVHVIPCVALRTDDQSVVMQAAVWGSICPAIWSFMLAARARGRGPAWAGVHLLLEEEAAAILGIPYAAVTLIPVAHTHGGDFHAAPRAPLETVLHWNAW